MTERHELWQLLDGIQMDIRAANAKMTSLRSFVAGMNIPNIDRPKCPVCGIERKGERQLAEHLYQLHDGPEPDHWQHDHHDEPELHP